MSGVSQIIFGNLRQFPPPPPGPPPAIGGAWAGGFYAGEIGVSGVATHYLVIGPLSTAQSTLAYKNAATAATGADSDIDGPQNTADLVAGGNSTVYPAAHFCNDLSIGGYTDWYLPARNEMDVCYFNLKPSTAVNSTTSGINVNAVPVRNSNFTLGTPAQTSVAAFQTGGAEALTVQGTSPFGNYWTSTESSATSSWGKTVSNGFNGTESKNGLRFVRAIRRVAVGDI